MSEMIERVARRIAQLITEPGLHPDSQMVQCTLLARAAIEAMREPTETMLKEAWADALAEDARGVWNTMIDAALN